MNKIFAMLLTAVFALTGISAVNTTESAQPSETVLAQESVIASGTVTALEDGSVTFTTVDGQALQALLTDATLLEYDVPGSDAPAVGDFIYVIYNGMMTRSIPAQITAQTIRCAARTGDVGEISEDSFLLLTELEEIQVNCTAEQLADLAAGSRVKVYFSGAMTMSLPAQIGADLITAAE